MYLYGIVCISSCWPGANWRKWWNEGGEDSPYSLIADPTSSQYGALPRPRLHVKRRIKWKCMKLLGKCGTNHWSQQRSACQVAVKMLS